MGSASLPAVHSTQRHPGSRVPAHAAATELLTSTRGIPEFRWQFSRITHAIALTAMHR